MQTLSFRDIRTTSGYIVKEETAAGRPVAIKRWDTRPTIVAFVVPADWHDGEDAPSPLYTWNTEALDALLVDHQPRAIAFGHGARLGAWMVPATPEWVGRVKWSR